ncbi:MAG: hypothetical protein RLZZ507_109 [Cyanobacteriota bacterium]|jgi:molecular chaperone DnaK (HSP70)
MTIAPKNSPYILGIDLGTSNSAIAIFRKGVAEILPIEGEKMCPSVVYIPKDQEAGEMVVGKKARKRLLIDPDNLVKSIKREMGTEWTKEFPASPGKKYTPVDISAEILSKLTAEAAQDVDKLRGTPRYAVICIPANFNDAQKTATIKASELANLEVLYLLEEPVAAAIAYGMEKQRNQTILVYDIGGGTFDVCILKLNSSLESTSCFEILAKAGISQLGGDDFDYEIMKIAAAKLLETSGINLLDDKKDQGISPNKIRNAQQKLKEEAEKAKWELSEAQTAKIDLPNLIADESGNMYNLELEITREDFNTAIKDLILQSKQALQQALASAKLEIGDIDRIIMIGGSSRVPLVRTMLTEMFGKEPYADTDPDTAVARGAAIFGANLGVPSDKIPETENVNPEDQFKGTVTINNIVTHFLGIEIAGGKFSCLLKKDLEIPTDQPLIEKKDYTTSRDNMTELVIRIYQSTELVEYVNDQGVKCIGEFFLTKIPPKSKGQEKITVTFAIDQQNLLKVQAVSSSSADELEITRA